MVCLWFFFATTVHRRRVHLPIRLHTVDADGSAVADFAKFLAVLNSAHRPHPAARVHCWRRWPNRTPTTNPPTRCPSSGASSKSRAVQ